ncbi:MAG: hypothetical protein E7439_02680 [Ruminococcaceae bacterium]|nr:hypothetical protein [Oscillospiraceae bacterium]
MKNGADTQTNKAKKIKIICISAAVVIVLIILLVQVIISYLVPNYHYQQALELIESEDYNEALEELDQCRDFKDTEEILDRFTVCYEDKRVTNTNYLGGESTRETTYKIKCEYDDYGNPILEIYYDEDGKIENKYVYTYDEHNNLLQATVYDKKDNVIYEAKLTYVYDEDDRISKMAFYDENESYSLLFRYDNGDDLVTLCVHYGRNTDIESTYECEYDEDGNEVRRIFKNGNGKKTGETTYKYDEYGNQIRSVTYDAEGEITEKTSSEYDRYGNRTRYTVYNSDGTPDYRQKVSYDDIAIVVYDEDKE